MASLKQLSGITLLLVGVMTSCVKDPQDIPPGFTGDSVFGLKAIFGDEQILLRAGSDQWTCQPVVTQEDSLVVYTSVFSQDGCLQDCASSWTFTFYQAPVFATTPEELFNSTIHPGKKELILSDEELDSFDVELSTHPALFMSGYSYWEDLNNQSTTFLNEFSTQVGYEQSMDVCFQSQAYTGCQYSQCIHFDPSTEVPCLVSIEPKLENPRYMSLSVRAEGTPPFQFQWYNESTSPSIVIPVRDTVAEIYAAVKVTDALGNSANLVQSVRLQNGVVDACYFPILLSSTPVPHGTSSHADRVEIVYVDELGQEWRSDLKAQPEESGLFIDTVTSYGLSPQQQPAYIVEGSVSALLVNAITGESKLFTSSQLALALSHP